MNLHLFNYPNPKIEPLLM